MTIYPNQKQQPSCQSFLGALSKHIAVPGHFNANVLVLNDPIYGENSRSMQKAIAKKSGLSVAAELLEQAFGLIPK